MVAEGFDKLNPEYQPQYEGSGQFIGRVLLLLIIQHPELTSITASKLGSYFTTLSACVRTPDQIGKFLNCICIGTASPVFRFDDRLRG